MCTGPCLAAHVDSSQNAKVAGTCGHCGAVTETCYMSECGKLMCDNCIKRLVRKFGPWCDDKDIYVKEGERNEREILLECTCKKNIFFIIHAGLTPKRSIYGGPTPDVSYTLSHGVGNLSTQWLYDRLERDCQSEREMKEEMGGCTKIKLVIRKYNKHYDRLEPTEDDVLIADSTEGSLLRQIQASSRFSSVEFSIIPI